MPRLCFQHEIKNESYQSRNNLPLLAAIPKRKPEYPQGSMHGWDRQIQTEQRANCACQRQSNLTTMASVM